MKHVLGGCIALICSSLYAANITGIQQANASGSYQLIFKDAGVLPKAFNTSEPNAAIVLDFAQTTSGMVEREVVVAQSGIYDVDIHEGNDRTRAVINLAFPMAYNISMSGKDVVVSINTSNVRATPVQPKVEAAPKSTALAGLMPTFRIGHQDSNKNGNKGIFTFNLPSEKTVVNIRNEGTTIIADIAGYKVNQSEQKRLDVTDYATPVKFIDIKRTSKGSRISLSLKDDYEFITYQNGTVYAIEVAKPEEKDATKEQLKGIDAFTEHKDYRGEPISLNFQDIEVRAVLQIIAEFTDRNIVVSDDVSGNITLRLDKVPWDQALDIILKTKDLGKRVNGNVIYIGPESRLNKAELDALVAIEERSSKTPPRTELMQIKYADADEIRNIIEQSRTLLNGQDISNGDAILSPRGRVTVDKRTNTLIVSDIPLKLKMVRELVTSLDEPVRQVLVDARLVKTTDNFERELGVRFSNVARNGSHMDGGLSTSSFGETSSGYQNNKDYKPYNAPALTTVNGGGNGTYTYPDVYNRLGVNIGGVGSAAQMGLAILSGDFLIGLELAAMQTEGKVEILSSPRVVTQDGAEAIIKTGQGVPYTTVQDGTPTTQEKEVTLSLTVKPRITPDNMVNMELKITDDSINRTVQGYGGGTDFVLDKNELKTDVLVDSGETLVLGGFYKQRQIQDTKKVPVLGDIPLVGNAFKTNVRQFNKDEMLIFITPRIIDKRLMQNDKFSNLRAN